MNSIVTCTPLKNDSMKDADRSLSRVSTQEAVFSSFLKQLAIKAKKQSRFSFRRRTDVERTINELYRITHMVNTACKFIRHDPAPYELGQPYEPRNAHKIIEHVHSELQALAAGIRIGFVNLATRPMDPAHTDAKSGRLVTFDGLDPRLVDLCVDPIIMEHPYLRDGVVFTLFAACDSVSYARFCRTITDFAMTKARLSHVCVDVPMKTLAEWDKPTPLQRAIPEGRTYAHETFHKVVRAVLDHMFFNNSFIRSHGRPFRPSTLERYYALEMGSDVVLCSQPVDEDFDPCGIEYEDVESFIGYDTHARLEFSKIIVPWNMQVVETRYTDDPLMRERTTRFRITSREVTKIIIILVMSGQMMVVDGATVAEFSNARQKVETSLVWLFMIYQVVNYFKPNWIPESFHHMFKRDEDTYVDVEAKLPKVNKKLQSGDAYERFTPEEKSCKNQIWREAFFGQFFQFLPNPRLTIHWLEKQSIVDSIIEKDDVWGRWFVQVVLSKRVREIWCSAQVLHEMHTSNCTMSKPYVDQALSVVAPVITSGVLKCANVMTRVKVPVTSINPIDSLAVVAGHPIADLFMVIQRAIFTPWLSGDGVGSHISVGVDIGVVLVRLYKIIPKTRMEWMATALQAIGGGLVLQNDDVKKETTLSTDPGVWNSFVETIKGDWSSSKASVKWMVAKLLAFTCTVPALWNDFFSAETYQEFFMSTAGSLQKKKTANDLIDCFFDMIQSTLQLAVMGSFTGAWDKHFATLEAEYTALHEEYTLYVTELIGDCYVIMDKLSNLASKYEKHSMKCSVLSSQKHCSDRVITLRQWSAVTNRTRDGQSKHYATKAMAFSGDAGVGKTMAMLYFADLMHHLVGITAIKGTISEESEFDDNITPYTTFGSADDTGKTKERYLKKPIGGQVIRFCTNDPSPLIKAEVSEKSSSFSHMLMMGFTGNSPGCGAYTGITFVPAIARRVWEFAVEPDPELCTYDGEVWKPNTPTMVPEPRHLRFKKCYNASTNPSAFDAKYQESMSFAEMKEWFSINFLMHHREQIRIVNGGCDTNFCEHGVYKMNCEECSRNNSLQNARTRVIVNTWNSTLHSFYRANYAHLSLMTNEELETEKSSCVLKFCGAFWLWFIAVFMIGSTSTTGVVTLLLARTIVDMCMVEYSTVGATIQSLTAMEAERAVTSNPLLGVGVVFAGISAASLMYALKSFRTTRLQSGGVEPRIEEDEAEISTEPEPKDKAPEKPDRSESDDDGEEVLVSLADQDLNHPSVLKLSRKVADMHAKGEPMNVAELKSLTRHEELVSQHTANYWQAPIRVKPVSTAGVGATNESVMEIVRGQTFYIDEPSTNAVTTRVCTMIRSGVAICNTHIVEKLVHKKAYVFKKRLDDGKLFKQVFSFDANTVVKLPESDIAVFRCAPVMGGSKDLLKYIPDSFARSDTLSGLVLVPSLDGRFTFSVHSSIMSIKPNTREYLGSVEILGIYENSLRFAPRNGMCGCMAVTNSSIIGFHAFGDENKFHMNGGPLFNKGLLTRTVEMTGTRIGDNMGPFLEREAASIQLTTPHYKEPTNFIGVANPLHFGSVARTFSLATQYEENPLAELYEKALGDKIVGLFTPAKGKYNKMAHNHMTVSMAHRGEDSFSEVKATVDNLLPENDLKRHWLAAKKDYPELLDRPKGISVALAGIPGHLYAHKIDKSKSASLPYFCKKGRFIEGEGNEIRLRGDFERDLLHTLLMVQSGLDPGLVAMVHAKDEPLPFKDYNFLDMVVQAQKDLRGFIGVDLICQILSKMYLDPILEFMQHDNTYFFNLVGMDPGSTEWHNMIEWMKDGAVQFTTGDQMNYDCTHNAAINEGLTYTFKKIAVAMGYTDMELAMLEIITNSMMNMYFCYNGPITKCLDVWTSGTPMTAIGGAWKTIIKLCNAILRVRPDLNARDIIKAMALGDDFFVAFLVEFCAEDIQKIFDYFVETGGYITDDTKTGLMKLESDFQKVGVLSRKTVYHDELGRWVGTLALKSLYRPLSCLKKGSSLHERMCDIAVGHMREGALYGREFFNKLMDAHRYVFKEKKWALPPLACLPYDDVIYMMNERDAKKTPRAHLQGDDAFDAEGGEEDQVEIRKIVEQPTSTENETIDTEDWSKYRVIQPAKQLPPLVHREILLTTESVPLDLYYTSSFRPVDLLLQNPTIQTRLESYTAIAFDLVIRFAATATKFHYGEFIAHAVYQPQFLDFQDDKREQHAFRMLLASQRTPVRFGLGADEGIGELRIPFFYGQAMMPLNRQAAGEYCEVRVDSVTPTRCASLDAATEGSVSIYARFENVTGLGHTPRQYQGMSPEEGPPKPSAILGRAARMVEPFTNVPGLRVPAEIAGGVLHGSSEIARMMGHSKPIEFGGTPYVAFASGPTANANSNIAGRKLTYDVHQGVAVDSRMGSQAGDEMSIRNLVSRDVIIATGSVPSTSNNFQSSWLSINVTPAIEMISGNRRLLTPQGLVSSTREYWHGTMVYDIKFVKTALVGGKIAVSYNAFGSEESGGPEIVDSITVDLKATERISIRVHWMSPYNFLRTFQYADASVFSPGSYEPRYCNGCLKFSTVQKITGTTDDQTIDYIVTARMEDEVFINPSYDLLSKRSIVGVSTGRRLNGEDETDEPPSDQNGGDNGGFNIPGGFFGPVTDVILDAVPRRPPGSLVSTILPSNFFRRTRFGRAFRRSLRSNPIPLLLKSGGGGIPSTAEPTPIPASTPAPITTSTPTRAPILSTLMPSLRPTEVPSLRPVTEEPTAVPTTRNPTVSPTFSITGSPTLPECEAIMKSVPIEWLGFRSSLGLQGTAWVVKENDEMSIQTSAFSSGSGRGVRFRLLSGSVVSANQPYTDVGGGVYEYIVEPGTTGWGNVTNVFTLTASAVVSEAWATLPAASAIREVDPTDLASRYGLVTGTRTIDGVQYFTAIAPEGTVLDLPVPGIPDGCRAPDDNYTVFSYFGRLAGGGLNLRQFGVSAVRFANAASLNVPVTGDGPTDIFAGFEIVRQNQLQGADPEPGDTVTFEIGEHVPIHEGLIRVHAGEDILSLRQDLKIFRPSTEIEATTETSYEALLHTHAPALTDVYSVLQYSFGAIRGGMVGIYRLFGDGHAFIQRGQRTYTGGSTLSDLVRGYEFVDTRVNPTITVEFPWYNPARFEYGRGSFGDPFDSNVRHVNINPVGGSLRVTEDLAVGEDFDMFLFMGAPVMLTN